jgi:hypothetical protein
VPAVLCETRRDHKSGNFTALTPIYEAPLKVAINEVDFRGALRFVYVESAAT